MGVPARKARAAATKVLAKPRPMVMTRCFRRRFSQKTPLPVRRIRVDVGSDQRLGRGAAWRVSPTQRKGSSRYENAKCRATRDEWIRGCGGRDVDRGDERASARGSARLLPDGSGDRRVGFPRERDDGRRRQRLELRERSATGATPEGAGQRRHLRVLGRPISLTRRTASCTSSTRTSVHRRTDSAEAVRPLDFIQARSSVPDPTAGHRRRLRSHGAVHQRRRATHRTARRASRRTRRRAPVVVCDDNVLCTTNVCDPAQGLRGLQLPASLHRQQPLHDRGLQPGDGHLCQHGRRRAPTTTSATESCNPATGQCQTDSDDVQRQQLCTTESAS